VSARVEGLSELEVERLDGVRRVETASACPSSPTMFAPLDFAKGSGALMQIGMLRAREF
jgi:hypothetical protein